MTSSRRLALVLVCGASLALGAFFGARWVKRTHASAAPESPRAPSPATSASAPAVVLHVPRAMGPIVIDGELDEPAWQKATARTNAFLDAKGAPARPYSDARLTWNADRLYVALYAADEDIRASQSGPDAPLWLDDAFHLALTRARETVSFDVSPKGQLTDARTIDGGIPDFGWTSGADVAVELDGTLDDATGDDEEWVVEMSIPLSVLESPPPGQPLGFVARRCDRPRNAARTCAEVGGTGRPVELVLDP